MYHKLFCWQALIKNFDRKEKSWNLKTKTVLPHLLMYNVINLLRVKIGGVGSIFDGQKNQWQTSRSIKWLELLYNQISYKIYS